MKLGPIQELWLSQLEKYPERQTNNRLGFKLSDGTYKACCLGEALLCIHRVKKWKLPFDTGVGAPIIDGNGGSAASLRRSYMKIGLRDSVGTFENVVPASDEKDSRHRKQCASLADMNDSGMSWPRIAAYVRTNPENVFTESK